MRGLVKGTMVINWEYQLTEDDDLSGTDAAEQAVLDQFHSSRLGVMDAEMPSGTKALLSTCRRLSLYPSDEEPEINSVEIY